MDSLTTILKRMGITMAVIVAMGIAGANLYLVSNTLTKNEQFTKTKKILDTNADGILSPEEVKKFYDETGLTPYASDILKANSINSLNEFISQYNAKVIYERNK